jgi:hypothetical protein
MKVHSQGNAREGRRIVVEASAPNTLVFSPVASAMGCAWVEMFSFAENVIAMVPVLMIERLKNLHDARYCAAVGISMVSFEMASEDPTALTPANVKEIAEWLSGVECVGRFGKDNLSSSFEIAQQSSLDWIQIPAGTSSEYITGRGEAMILDASGLQWSPELYGSLRAFSELYPAALVLLHLIPGFLPTIAHSEPFLKRCILRLDDPEVILQQLAQPNLRPYGFSLGAFALHADGELDYDACDSFISQYEEFFVS